MVQNNVSRILACSPGMIISAPESRGMSSLKGIFHVSMKMTWMYLLVMGLVRPPSPLERK